ncbi:hypothetical protein ACH35V_28680 [Actinomadura sp. 1N219]|uniref:hypothetical protein n=1 Tax=Actinomadura sp. 1N219 TaxID=3375152 RepID=UPI0037A0B1F3
MLLAELTAVTAQIAVLRPAKQNAIDAREFERPAGIRDEEKPTPRRAVGEFDEQTAKARLATAPDMSMQLQAEVDRLLVCCITGMEVTFDLGLLCSRPFVRNVASTVGWRLTMRWATGHTQGNRQPWTSGSAGSPEVQRRRPASG